MSKSFRTSFRKTMCTCVGGEEDQELVCMGNSMGFVARIEEKGRTDDAQPQICCNHRDKTVVTNNSGLRINLSKGKHANTYRYGELNFRCI